MAKDVWLSPGEALAHLGWNSADAKQVAKLKNAFTHRKEFEGKVEKRVLHPAFPNKTGTFVNRDALDAYAQNLAQEALEPRKRGRSVSPNASKVYRLNVSGEEAERINNGEPLTQVTSNRLYRYIAPKRQSTSKRKPQSESTNGVEAVEMELIEA